MSSGSLKDLIKSLHNVFSVAPTPIPVDGLYSSIDLPVEAQNTIQAYLDKHNSIEDSDSQRLHEELSTVHKKHVIPSVSKLAAFLNVIALVQPLLNGQARLTEWWEVAVGPVINGPTSKLVEIDNATDFLLRILDYDAEADVTGDKAKTSSHFAKILLDAYLKRTAAQESESDALMQQDDFIASKLEKVLIAFGRKKPKDFMQSIDRLVVDKSHRIQALGLLSTFVRHQPPHLYLASQTPLIEHLLKCLMIDTSSIVISLALTCLIMFLPHIPSSVKAHLPRLFLIYSRLLCWERFFPSSHVEGNENSEQDVANDTPEGGDAIPDVAEGEGWEQLQSSSDSSESTPPELIHYFTFLYGLYPLNFISYIRKPRRYLKDINFPRAEDFDLDRTVIRSRTEQFGRVHLIHPNFYNTTAEDELTDNRWLKSDPSDVVSECMSLCIAEYDLDKESEARTTMAASQVLSAEKTSAGDLGDDNEPPILSRDPEDDQSDTLAGSVASSSRERQRVPSIHSPAASSPKLRPEDGNVEGFLTPTPEIRSIPPINTTLNPRSSASSLPSTSNQSPQPSSTSRFQAPTSIRTKPQPEANTGFLQREVTLLRNKVNFERYLNQQKLTHIGQLQRRHIAEATVEAETQNLINTNRALKAKLAKANEACASLRKEAAVSRQHSKKWEADLTNRVKTLSQAERELQADNQQLTFENEDAKRENEQLKQIIVETEARETLAKQERETADYKLEQLESLQARIRELEESVREYQARDLLSAQRHEENEALREELEKAKMMQEAQQYDQEQVGKRFDVRYSELHERFHEAQNPTAGGPTGELAPHVKVLIGRAVEPMQARLEELSKEHEALRQRTAELETAKKQ